jgi:hypothetical protein
MLRPHLAAGKESHLHRRVSETRGLLLSHPAKWSHRPKLHRDLRVTSARSCWLNDDGEMVRQAGYAPASPVWKTEILLLNDWRI